MVLRPGEGPDMQLSFQSNWETVNSECALEREEAVVSKIRGKLGEVSTSHTQKIDIMTKIAYKPY